MTFAQYLVADLPAGDSLVLDGPEGRHAATVKRARVGEQLLISDGRGSVVTGTVTAVDRDRVELSVDSRQIVVAPDPRLVVVQALPKGDRADLAIELLTELGVDEIVPWAAAHSVARWDSGKADRGVERWERTAREATKQSRRAWLPVVAGLASTAEVAARLSAATTALVLHEDASSGLGSVSLPAAGEVVLVVGPEGGISPDEISAFVAAGAAPVHLGVEVLRTSTAGGAALAALNLRLSRWH
jgi:16S rRNA (uracil1498-N3)-methyltransferase